MTTAPAARLRPPRIIAPRAFCFIGLDRRQDAQSRVSIPLQWSEFAPHVGTIPGEIRGATFGVLHDGDDDGVGYLTAVEVGPHAEAPQGLTRLLAPATAYAAFRHEGHAAQINEIWASIFAEQLPAAGLRPRRAPDLERYGPGFDPRTGEGDIEIWIPIEI